MGKAFMVVTVVTFWSRILSFSARCDMNVCCYSGVP